MRPLLITLFGLFLSLSVDAQVFHNAQNSGCEIEVAYAISESEGTGEYVMTDLILLNPGMSWDYSVEALSARNLFAGEDFEVMFIVRYPSTGMTFYINGNVQDDFKTTVIGCSSGTKHIYSRDGEFHFE